MNNDHRVDSGRRYIDQYRIQKWFSVIFQFLHFSVSQLLMHLVVNYAQWLWLLFSCERILSLKIENRPKTKIDILEYTVLINKHTSNH